VRRIALAVRDRELARGSTRSNSASRLLAHEVADELAEPVHVLAQRLSFSAKKMLARTVRDVDDDIAA